MEKFGVLDQQALSLGEGSGSSTTFLAWRLLFWAVGFSVLRVGVVPRRRSAFFIAL